MRTFSFFFLFVLNPLQVSAQSDVKQTSFRAENFETVADGVVCGTGIELRLKNSKRLIGCQCGHKLFLWSPKVSFEVSQSENPCVTAMLGTHVKSLQVDELACKEVSLKAVDDLSSDVRKIITMNLPVKQEVASKARSPKELVKRKFPLKPAPRMQTVRTPPKLSLKQGIEELGELQIPFGQYDFNYEDKKQAEAELKKLSAFLKDYPQLRIRVVAVADFCTEADYRKGYSDSKGSAIAADEIAVVKDVVQGRAMLIGRSLFDQGLPKERFISFTVAKLGSNLKKPLRDCKISGTNKENERILVKFYDSKGAYVDPKNL